MNNFPLVSVFIPAYNHEKYIADSIESVINQTYKNIELLIINDASTDNTNQIILKYIDECRNRFIRFEYRNNTENKGITNSMNESVKWARGKYFTANASDDIMMPCKIKVLVEALENNKDDNISVAFGEASYINESGENIYFDIKTGKLIDDNIGVNNLIERYSLMRNINYKDSRIFGSYDSLINGDYLPPGGYMLKTKMLHKISAWTDGNTAEDWELWLKLSKISKFIYIDKVVYLYRIHSTNTVNVNHKGLVYSHLNLLKREKEYAFKLGKEKIYWNNFSNIVLTILFHFSLSDAIKEIFENLYNFVFLNNLVFNFFKRIYDKIFRLSSYIVKYLKRI
ncbi:MAG: glycosyltransferase family 2 protein [Elusimicrobia bacterium]|jgi:alpha-1,3-rhamnosyltransferase|nr:glycosyltransferase family 2 protein [Elusimicrobiota bacterium]